MCSFVQPKVIEVQDSTLFHVDDVPFQPSFNDVPDLFTDFKNKVESKCRVRTIVPKPANNSLPLIPEQSTSIFCTPTSNFNFLPTLEMLGFTPQEVAIQPDSRSAFPFRGGETAALTRVQDWIFTEDNLKDYFDIRNGMIGTRYSSKFSPWLALGCLSPRYAIPFNLMTTV